MRDRRWLVILSALAAACAGPLASAHSPLDNKQAHDLAQLVDRSNLVFVGQARRVVYRNARGEEGEGPIPYTIVTYRIERVLRGKAPGGEITMRFVGGPDGRGRFLTVSGVPVVQEGDRDLLFVASTEDASCPLVFCEYGRYRILNEDVFDTHGLPVLAIDKAVVLGLLHVNTEYNIMDNDFEHIHVNGSTATAYTGEDAADATVFLYGARSPAWEDVGVVHWKYSGASGEYSDHTKTVIYDTSGAVLPTVNVVGETGYRVNRGQTVRAEFTYENNGASFHSGIQTGYYISTNDLITTSDRKIGSGSFNLSRDNVFTTTVDLVIPRDLVSGRDYWLGVIIDDNGAIRESVESNNATYTTIHVN